MVLSMVLYLKLEYLDDWQANVEGRMVAAVANTLKQRGRRGITIA